ncbi:MULTISPECIES: hypothetical protein [unclassified Crossiella]|uniref:hypothetical protein n=1 Tax=unclassified Crossiella TaxID=2620835 RepID=UPI001FFEC92C|nr:MULTISPECIES: hypothetical protein [unclassified Crossiella]MCK2243290.1 hypothetical protein [Crossiella sp. S99.2]MCK2254241.1 hypothetical protein [Crossiella sp. S99.1]
MIFFQGQQVPPRQVWIWAPLARRSRWRSFQLSVPFFVAAVVLGSAIPVLGEQVFVGKAGLDFVTFFLGRRLYPRPDL